MRPPESYADCGASEPTGETHAARPATAYSRGAAIHGGQEEFFDRVERSDPQHLLLEGGGSTVLRPRCLPELARMPGSMSFRETRDRSSDVSKYLP